MGTVCTHGKFYVALVSGMVALGRGCWGEAEAQVARQRDALLCAGNVKRRPCSVQHSLRIEQLLASCDYCSA